MAINTPTPLATISTGASALNAPLFTAQDMSPYAAVCINITGTWVGTITFQASQDNVNWYNTIAMGPSGVYTRDTQAKGIFTIYPNTRYYRAIFTAYTSGTAFANVDAYFEAAPQIPMTSVYTSQSVKYATPTTYTGTADVAIMPAVAGSRNYIMSLQVKNVTGTASEIVIKDGTTVVWRGHLNGTMNQNENIQFLQPISSSVNSALNFAAITTGTSIYVNAQGYVAP